MFGADIAYMDSCIDQEYTPSAVLPEYLYPAFRLPNPWHRQSNTTQLDTDIIIIAEFSELEGPKPVIVIPNDRDLHFNVNDFTVRIMSVDQGSSGQQGFNMPEDCQVMMSDTKENVYAFVHHFVLLDKQARGYSRPFAISYVTPDQRKLLNFYEEISSNFKKIARYLKYGNKLVFKNDLDKFMIDLQYTKDQMVNRFRSMKQPVHTDQDNRLLQTLKILESQNAEIQTVLNQLNPTLTDKRMEQRFTKIEERAQLNHTKVRYTESGSLCDWDSIETPEYQIQFASLGNTPETENLLFFDSQNYKPKLVEVTKGRKFDLHLRGLHELCSWGAKEGLQKLRHIYQYFKQDLAVLQMEKKDLCLLDPPSGLITFGNQFIAANLMANIDKICISTCCFMRVPSTRTKSMESWTLLGGSWGSTDTLSSFKSLPSSFQSFVEEDSDSDSMLSVTSDLSGYIQRTSSIGSFQIVGSFDSLRNSMSSHTSEKQHSPEEENLKSNSRENFKDENNQNKSKNEKQAVSNDGENFKNDFPQTKKDNNSSCNVEKQRSSIEETLTQSDIDKLVDVSKKSNQEVDINNFSISPNSNFINFPSKSNSINVSEDDMKLEIDRDRSSTVTNLTASKNISHSDKNLEYRKIETEKFEEPETTNNDLTINHENMEDLNSDISEALDNENDFSDQPDTQRGRNGTLTSCDAIENLGILISSSNSRCEDCPYQDLESSSGISSCSGYHSKVSAQSLSDVTNGDTSRRGSRSDTEPSLLTDIFRFDVHPDTVNAGFGISTACLAYNHLQNVVYSLLTGQTVVVIGSAQFEEEIRGVVSALKLFLPGCYSKNSCIPWCHKSLTVKNLTDVKLIGLCRHEKKSVDRMIPKAVQKYVTLLDVERRVLASPSYQGSLVTTILSRKKSFKTEECYINFIKGALCDFAAKAFIYYHSFCLGQMGTGVVDKESVYGESESLKKTTTAFLSKLGVQDSDVHIIEYLTDLVKYQHIEDHYRSTGSTGTPPRPVSRNIPPLAVQRL